MKDKRKFVQYVESILILMKWKEIILFLGKKAEKQFQIIAKCYVETVIEKSKTYEY